jgi:hypothetical protein
MLYYKKKIKKDIAISNIKGENVTIDLISISIYCKSTFILWHQFSWFLQNALIPGFLHSWFQTLQATINGKFFYFV